jgi:hypothetical protein
MRNIRPYPYYINKIRNIIIIPFPFYLSFKPNNIIS